MRAPLKPLGLCILIACACSAADAPPAAPATLLGGKIEFTPPDGWTPQQGSLKGDTAAIYMAPDHDGFFAIQVLPENAATSPAAAKKIVTLLHDTHKKSKQEIVKEPTIDGDKRFAIDIHEQYKTKDGKTADERHLFRQVGGRAVELDVQSVSDDAEKVSAVHKAGEECLASAKWVKPAAPVKKKA